MSKIILRGMTWDHRRAVDPLLATLPDFHRQNLNIEVHWASRPLQGFEFTSVAALAEDYDIIVFDHPFVGNIAETQSLQPLDSMLKGLEQAFVGPSLESYRYGGHLWALPIDAACQAAVARSDLLAKLEQPVPSTWSEMVQFGTRAAARGLRLAIGLKGVHSLMTFFTLCANLGRPCASEPTQEFVDAETGRAALEALHRLVALCPPEAALWNSIALHEEMVARDDLVYCPLVYGYATYAEADMRRPLRFFDIPGLLDPSPRGSTIGGAGIGISARCAEMEAALHYVSYLCEPTTQRVFANNHGQPARVEMWTDPTIDERFGNFFTSTRATIDAAWVRPRYAGYLRFQEAGGSLVEQHLRGEIGADDLLGRLSQLHASSGDCLIK
jgi:multiple sugar transport system substrate-binding protein